MSIFDTMSREEQQRFHEWVGFASGDYDGDYMTHEWAVPPEEAPSGDHHA